MTTHPVHPAGAGTGHATLADRYVHAATRGLPEDQRDDIGNELRGSIADRVTSLHEKRPDISTANAEHTALLELGDPDLLAASYAGRSRQLIGPEVYPAYVRVLKAVLVTAVPAATIVVAAIDAVEGNSIGAVIGGAAWMAFIVATQVAFWVTLTFALIERGRSAAPGDRSPTAQWAPDQLPELLTGPRGSVGDLVTNVTWLGVLGAVIVLQHPSWPIYDDSKLQPLLEPDLWSFWLPLILVLLVVEMGFELMKYHVSSWTPRLATINLVIGALLAAPWVILAGSSQLFNPTAVTEISNSWPGFDAATASTVVILTALAIWVWNSINGWRKTRAA